MSLKIISVVMTLLGTSIVLAQNTSPTQQEGHRKTGPSTIATLFKGIEKTMMACQASRSSGIGRHREDILADRYERDLITPVQSKDVEPLCSSSSFSNKKPHHTNTPQTVGGGTTNRVMNSRV